MSLLLRAYPLMVPVRAKPSVTFIVHSILRPLFSKTLSGNRRAHFSVSASSTPSVSNETLFQTPKPPPIPVKETLDWVNRTGFCGEISVDDVGKRVRLCGWVALHRVHGGLTFFNLRDHTGTVQVRVLIAFCFIGFSFFRWNFPGKIFWTGYSWFWWCVKVTTLPDDFPDAHLTINDLRLEYVVAVEGLVRQRPTESINKKMKTGYIEV